MNNLTEKEAISLRLFDETKPYINKLVESIYKTYLTRQDIEDLYQEAFLALWTCAHTYKPEKYSMSFKSYAAKYVFNALYAYIGREEKRNFLNKIVSLYELIDRNSNVSLEDIIEDDKSTDIKSVTLNHMLTIINSLDLNDDDILSFKCKIETNYGDVIKIERRKEITNNENF